MDILISFSAKLRYQKTKLNASEKENKSNASFFSPKQMKYKVNRISICHSSR